LIVFIFRDPPKGDGMGGRRGWGFKSCISTVVKPATRMFLSWIIHFWLYYIFILRQNFIVYNENICKNLCWF
jgi:hypothetical protein